MSDGLLFTLIIVGTVSAILSPVFFIEILPSIIESQRDRKQSNCMHLWRRLDGDYKYSETIFRYRCEKCKLEKKLWESEAERFEEDFMSDWQ